MISRACERPEPRVDTEPRCHSCGRKLAMLLARPWRINCPRCKKTNEGIDTQNAAGQGSQS
jgi:phage FluMu protein Com